MQGCLRWEIRLFSLSSQLLRSHYDVLGVTRNSTIKEIKAAYFRLSKLYHPDRNDGPEAAEKFREITEAYECLKNNHNPRDQQPAKPRPDPEVSRPFRGPFQGRTSHFDFDEWERQHYGDQVRRSMRDRARNSNYEARRREMHRLGNLSRQLYILTLFFALLAFTMGRSVSDLDDPKPVKRDR